MSESVQLTETIQGNTKIGGPLDNVGSYQNRLHITKTQTAAFSLEVDWQKTQLLNDTISFWPTIPKPWKLNKNCQVWQDICKCVIKGPVCCSFSCMRCNAVLKLHDSKVIIP